MQIIIHEIIDLEGERERVLEGKSLAVSLIHVPVITVKELNETEGEHTHHIGPSTCVLCTTHN